MFAIDDATAVAVMPTPEAAGTPGYFTEGNPALGQAATYVRASFLNALIQEMLNILTAAGITPSKTTYDQLLSSFRSNALVTANDTGPANACAIAYTPAITTLTDGMVLWFKAAAANTGATTLAVNAVGVKNLVGGAHQPLQGGEIVAGGKCMVVWNAAIPAFVLVECTGAALQVAAASKSGHAPQLAQLHSAYATRGLAAANNATTPLTKYDASANLVVLRNPTTGALATSPAAAAITNDITVAGPTANGRDQASAFTASTWVHFYFIWNGTTLATLSSAVAPPTGPTLPSGYTHWCYIGAVVLNASTQLSAVKIRGAWATYDTPTAILSGSATTLTPFSTAALVPPNAMEYKPLISNFAFSATAGGVYSGTLFVDSYQVGISGTGGASAVVSCSGGSCLLPNVGQSSSYRINIASGSGPTTTIQVQGYKLPNGGE